MTLKDIATISGKPGLYRIIKPAQTGVVLESLDENKKRIVANLGQRVSVLQDISIYTTSAEGSKPLKDIMIKIKDEFGEEIGLDRKSDKDEYKSFFRHILPDFDEERVYASDIKKIVKWYGIISKEFPALLIDKDEK